MYLARVVLGRTLSESGRLFGRDRTTAAHACNLVEDLRDDARIDAFMDVLERLVQRATSRPTGAGR
jgi:chromosomal replication initiation ATPase DnaA